MRKCDFEGCDRKHVAKGYCAKHYYRLHINGTLDTLRTEPGTCLPFLEALIGHMGDTCIPWPYWKYGNGYGGITIKRKKYIVSRVMCKLSHGEPESDAMQCAHSCGNRDCVNPNHLRWATVVENHADKILHGRTNRGERQGSSVLTEVQVIWARKEYAKGGTTYKKLSGEIGVKRGTLAAAIKGPNWKFVEAPKPQPVQEGLDL